MKTSNLSFLRQYLAELPKDTMISSDELYKIVEVMCPFMTEEQQKELIKGIKEFLNK